jgi:hypothetical protein
MPDPINRAVTSPGNATPRRSIHSKNFPAVYLQNASVEGVQFIAWRGSNWR